MISSEEISGKAASPVEGIAFGEHSLIESRGSIFPWRESRNHKYIKSLLVGPTWPAGQNRRCRRWAGNVCTSSGRVAAEAGERLEAGLAHYLRESLLRHDVGVNRGDPHQNSKISNDRATTPKKKADAGPRNGPMLGPSAQRNRHRRLSIWAHHALRTAAKARIVILEKKTKSSESPAMKNGGLVATAAATRRPKKTSALSCPRRRHFTRGPAAALSGAITSREGAPNLV